jgi:hypothetical protein
MDPLTHLLGRAGEMVPVRQTAGYKIRPDAGEARISPERKEFHDSTITTKRVSGFQEPKSLLRLFEKRRR